MSTERNVIFDLNIDLSGFIDAMEKARISVVRFHERLFGPYADDLSNEWPSCICNHDDWFGSNPTRPCPCCEAAL